jgi:hypothetical protein
VLALKILDDVEALMDVLKDKGSTLMGDILVITEHLKGEFQDITLKCWTGPRKWPESSGGQCVAVTFGSMNGKAGELGAADAVISVGGSDDSIPSLMQQRYSL